MTYFRQTPRNILSQHEKDQTIAAVNRAMIHLSERYRSFTMPEFNSLNDATRSFQYSRNIMPFMSRMVTLTKGSMQPKRLYRERRTRELYRASQKIAKETGADEQEIFRKFTHDMHRFLHL